MADNRTMSARRMTLAKASSAIALATGLAIGAAGPAFAQAAAGGAFEGNPTVVSGGVSIVRTPGIDNIQVDTDQAVINWTTNDTALTGGPINFLPAGRTAFYRNNPSAQNQFTVLNRIIPAGTGRAVQFNGTIISQLQTAAGLVSGGNVWFYSPGGIVVGATGVIDVGGLVLTSLDPVRDGAGNFISPAGSVTFGPAASSTSFVQTNPGAQIRATPENSYIAMVAPTVFQGGSVSVNGSALYVGAEAATVTFGTGGLFDIQVTTGTNGTGGVAISHSGTTTGPASSGAGDNHRIYMVAVPRNNAITIALSGGSLGFDVAGAADVVGNSIILSSGYNVFGDAIDTSTPVNPAQQANISVRDIAITSSFNAAAANELAVLALTGNVSFAGRADLFGANTARVDADGATRTVTFASDLFMSVNDFGINPGEAAQGGLAVLRTANSGSISIGGSAFLSASARGGDNFSGGSVGSGTGGRVDLVNSTGGSLQIAGDLTIDVQGFAGGSGTAGIGSNFGRGGNVGLFALDGNASLRVDGATAILAQGFGSSDFGSAAGTGGAGFGGRVDVFARGLGNSMRFGGSFFAAVDGSGGQSTGTGTGGAGTGGLTFISTDGQSRLDFLSNLSLFSFGFGGDAAGAAGATGGVATGGTASLSMGGARGIIAVGGNLLMQASANGGQGLVNGANGGLGTGGTAIILQSGNAGQLSVAGTTSVESFGIGGRGTIGGDGIGGSAQVTALSSGRLALGNGLNVDGSGLGGTPNTVGAGRSGNGIGSNLVRVAAEANGVINVTGQVTVSSNGAVFGDALAGVDGGNGTGGNASIQQSTSGIITINGDVVVSAIGTGDANYGGGDGIAGNGRGGNATISAVDSTITITGNATADARGFGGANIGGLSGGDGFGGSAGLSAGGTLAIGGSGTALADAIGGSSLTNGSGGVGLGGIAFMNSVPAGIFRITGGANLSAQGFGGNALGTGNVGGLGDGGTAQISAINGALTVDGITTLSASAFGGSAAAGASSGAALGGLVSLSSQGVGQLTFNQDTFLSAQALSGNVDDGAGNSAAATGGTVNVFATGPTGAITVNGRLFADAITGVGSAVTGTIGDALGGTVEFAAALGGRLNLTGGVSMDATAFGGNSTQTGNGGNATGGRTALVIGNQGNGIINLGSTLTMISNGFGGLAHTGNGGIGIGGLSEVGTIDVAGTLTFGGAVSMSANGVGGDSVIAGNGGNGTGGTSRLGSNNAQMTGGDLFIGAIGRGGNGALGGRGGDATGGLSILNAGLGTIVGLLDFDNVNMSADAFGGAGGAGADGATGGAGGAGGNATGGRVNAFGSARNGQLDIGNLQVTMNGFGGFGGAGGAGTSGLGGVGGAGGIGTGGSTQIGTISNTILTGPNPTPTGFMTMNNAVVEANGFGGTGGGGGTGATGNGNGGAGGLGDGGDIFFATRGSLVSVNALTLIANGAGGTGGTGAIGGNGGNGISGVIGVESTEQFSAPTNRGRLVAGDIVAVARGTGGTGTVTGTGFYDTGSFFRAVNGDVTATRIVFNIGNAGDTAEPTDIIEDFVRISDATVNAGSSFTFITPGQLSVLVNNGSLSAGGVGLVAGTFVPDTVITAPTNIGSITASSLSLQSSGNLIVTANLNATQNMTFVVPGAVTLGNITGGGSIGISGSSLTLGNLNAGTQINMRSTSGAIAAGNLSAANFIAMTAANGLTLGVATSSTGFIDLLVQAGNITVGNLTAGTFISLEATNGSILASNLTSGAETDLDAIGSVTFGTAVTGLSFGVQTNGNITGGNITTSGVFPGDFYGIGLATQSGTIQVGTLTAVNNVGLLAAGAINAGAISTGASFIALGGSDIAIAGPLTAGTGPNNYVYFGNASMASSLGVNFDPAPVFALTPVRTPGSVTIGGAVQGGNVVAGVGTALAVNGDITANGGTINITANSVTAQNISSTLATAINAANGNLQLGNVVSTGNSTAGGVVLTASGTINAGAISTGTTPGLGVSVDGAGTVSIGGVTATGAAQLRSRTASFTSTGAITGASVNISGTAIALTNVTSTAGAIAMAATAGNLAFGTLTSSANTQFTATGSVTGGNITAGTWIGTTVGGNMTLGNLRSTGAGTSPNGFSIGLGAQGAIVTGTIDSFGLLGIGSDDGQGNLGNAASITTGAITAGGSVLLRSNQGLTTAAITSSNEIRVRGGSVTTGALQATNAILAAATAGSLTTGNVTTGASAALLASQSVTTGAISTGTSGTTFIGNSSAIPATGLISAINLTTLLASTPVRVGGTISIGAPVSTGTLLAAANNGFSASGAITAGTRITIDTSGTAVFGGLAAAPTISVTSGDIAFSQAGGLGNANTGTLSLINSSDSQMIIGGTTQSETYVLDAGEISRLRAGNIVISSPIAGSSGIGIEIRGFTLNGSGATSGNNLNGSEGSLSFQTTSTIRVNGNAIFNSMATTNRVALSAGRVEINADTGGIFLNGSSPGGTLSISANNIHIAGAELLGRLAENVNFVGRDTALGAPITTSRPDGVIQASRLQFNVGSTLLIQNTGTSLLGAGFFGRVGSFEIVPRSSSSQSSSASQIDLVIYGQLLDTGDIARNGNSVRDLIFPRSSSAGAPTDGSVAGFTSNSSVNGCLLSAVSCGQGGITEESPTVVAHAGPPPPKPAEERQAEREQEEAEAAAEEAARGEAAPRRPIMPPVTIVNTRRLGVEPVIDEPVTSGGNPNLQLDQALPDTGGQP